MKARSQPRFDIDALRDRAGDKVFARGEAYHRDGQVEILAIEPSRVLAQVEGSEDYRVELVGRGKKIGGKCSCPAFEDWGFCKHMVATALAVNAAVSAGETEGAGALSRIRAHLNKKDAGALADMILELAERDPALFRKLDLAAGASLDGDGKAIEARLRKLIDSATRPRDYIDYRRAPDWAAGVRTALEPLAALAQGARAGLAVKLTEQAIDRIEEAMGSIDDSDGHCGGLLEQARDIHLAATLVAKPEPVAFARNLFAREMENDYDTFSGAAALYAKVLGKPGLAEYRRLATAAWDKLPSRSGQVRTTDEFAGSYHLLQSILDFFAERDGDVDFRIALRAKDLTSSWRYLQLAEFCLAQGRREEALRRAEEGLWMFEDGQPDERLVLFTAKLLEKVGRKEDAETHLQQTFEKAPSLELYKLLGKLGGKPARESAVKFLESRAARSARTRWHYSADLLIEILMHEKMFDAAWATVHKHGASTSMKDDLARKSEKTHPDEALRVYAERVDQFANTGGNSAYEEAAKLIVRMATLRSAAEQAIHVAALKERFGRKRNFMKLLG